MKVTVCQLNDSSMEFEKDWEGLVNHVQKEASELVLLPEMPFTPWFGTSPHFDPAVWQAVVNKHETWMHRLKDLDPAVVLTSRPVNKGDKRLNEGFIWDSKNGYQPGHQKYYLPDEDGFWEASWYDRGDGEFSSRLSFGLRLGFLICTELWFMHCARAYGKQGAHLIVTPRASGKKTVEKWLTAGRTAAIISGAFSLSSNHYSASENFGGQGWIINPEGEVLGITTPADPFLTVDINLSEAEQAKETYPRYVID
jgi:N-carbamoylputrescine amidase